MRIWLDSMVLNQLTDPLEVLQNLIENKHKLVIANTAIDVLCFQKDPEWLEDQLEDGTVSIEIWHTPDEMVSKPFFWSSFFAETQAAESLEEAIAGLDNEEAILDLANIIYEYGIPEGQWYAEEISPAELSDEMAAGLAIDEASTRSKVLEAAIIADRMELFEQYTVHYIKCLANQHICDAIINCDGSITKI